ncbi:hypothetical protein [Haloferax prahovense]|uniref:hypothetical protein n=1 Tax=Haloferax prahovense TaxID=381852 RepID=UPI0013BE8C28|nr:hypothetical protein [Haloferax prahovense]
MDRSTIAGTTLILVGVLGYVAGIYVAYPGRAFSITVLMVGIALVAIAQQSATRGDA